MASSENEPLILGKSSVEKIKPPSVPRQESSDTAAAIDATIEEKETASPEIEPRFYLDLSPAFDPTALGFEAPTQYRQHYLNDDRLPQLESITQLDIPKNAMLRIRFRDGSAFFEYKAETPDSNFLNELDEPFEIPLALAEELCEGTPSVKKNRFKKSVTIHGNELTLELDDIPTSTQGQNRWILEVEVPTEEFANILRSQSSIIAQSAGISLDKTVIDITHCEGWSNYDIALSEGAPDYPSQRTYGDVFQGLEALNCEINRQLENINPGESLFMANAGGSASGKSFSSEGLVAKMLKEKGITPEEIDARQVYETDEYQIMIIGMDDYYWAFNQLAAKFEAMGEPLNFDRPEALKLEKLAVDLQALAENKTLVEIPTHDYKIAEEDEREFRTIQPSTDKKRLIIVDGLFAMHPRIQENMDMKVFVEADGHTRFLRRLMRDPSRLLTSRDNVASFYLQNVVAEHQAHVQPQQNDADIVIQNNFSQPEIAKLTAQTSQAKFEIAPSEVTEITRKIEQELQANFLREYEEVDVYCDLGANHQTDQVVRLRSSADKYAFSYKGPEQDGTRKFLQVPLNFNQDQFLDFAKQFTGLYPSQQTTIRKNRQEFDTGEGVIICIDTVTSNGEDLGTFVELKSSLKSEAQDKIQAIAKQLKPTEAIQHTPYYQLAQEAA